MKITRNQLQGLIKQEIFKSLSENSSSDLREDLMDPMDTEAESSMSLDDLLDFAKAYSKLSRDMRQVLDFVMDGRGESVTTDEIEDLQAALGGYNSDLDDYLKEAHKAAQLYTDEEIDDGTFAAAVRMNR